MSIAGGLDLALWRGHRVGCDVIQVFTKSSQQWAARAITEGERERWLLARESTGIWPALAHTSYLINLAAPTRGERARAYSSLALEYARCQALEISALVLHPGAHRGQGEARGIGHIAAALRRLGDEHDTRATRLLLENTAGQGTSIGHDFAHLRDIIAAVPRNDWLGVCLDTCHLFAAGYDLRDAPAFRRTSARLAAQLGWDRVGALHLNDSRGPLAGHLDRHAHIGRGMLGLESFRLVVNHPRLRRLPMVLETPKPDERADRANLAVLRCLAGTARVSARARRTLRSVPRMG